MLKQLCTVFLFVLFFGTPVFAQDNQAEGGTLPLPDPDTTELLQKPETAVDMETLPPDSQESDTEDYGPSIYDDEHG